jgi:hypothetical protein
MQYITYKTELNCNILQPLDYKSDVVQLDTLGCENMPQTYEQHSPDNFKKVKNALNFFAGFLFLVA